MNTQPGIDEVLAETAKYGSPMSRLVSRATWDALDAITSSPPDRERYDAIRTGPLGTNHLVAVSLCLKGVEKAPHATALLNLVNQMDEVNRAGN